MTWGMRALAGKLLDGRRQEDVMNHGRIGTIVVVAAFAVGANVASAIDHPLEGRKLLLKDGTVRGKLTFLSKDANIAGPTAEELAALQLAGEDALLEVCAENGDQGEEDLAIDAFSVNKKGLVKYRVKGQTDGVKVITLKPGRTLKIVGKDPLVLLDEPTGGVGIRLTIGEHVDCARFPADTMKRDGEGRVKARRSAAPGACDDVSLGCAPVGSPNGAFVE